MTDTKYSGKDRGYIAAMSILQPFQEMLNKMEQQDQRQRSWDEYFMGMSVYVASRSKDKGTKVGAVIVGPDNRVRSTGYNGFPSKVNEGHERTRERATKLLFTEHAERNAIYSAARAGVTLDGCTLYVCGLYPCAPCARAIIQSGIRAVVVTDNTTFPERWKDSMEAAEEMLEEAGVEVRVQESEPGVPVPDIHGADWPNGEGG